MPAVATKASTVTCGHVGIVATGGTSKLTVAGSPVLLAAGVQNMAVSTTCTIVPNTGPPASSKCTIVTGVANPPSLATKLFVAGAPVVLATLKGSTNGVIAGAPQTLLSATVPQTLLTTV